MLTQSSPVPSWAHRSPIERYIFYSALNIVSTTIDELRWIVDPIEKWHTHLYRNDKKLDELIPPSEYISLLPNEIDRLFDFVEGATRWSVSVGDEKAVLFLERFPDTKNCSEVRVRWAEKPDHNSSELALTFWDGGGDLFDIAKQ